MHKCEFTAIEGVVVHAESPQRALERNERQGDQAEPAAYRSRNAIQTADCQTNSTKANGIRKETMAMFEKPVEAEILQKYGDDFPWPPETARIDHADAVARHAGAEKQQRKREEHGQHGQAMQPARANRC